MKRKIITGLKKSKVIEEREFKYYMQSKAESEIDLIDLTFYYNKN